MSLNCDNNLIELLKKIKMIYPVMWIESFNFANFII